MSTNYRRVVDSLKHALAGRSREHLVRLRPRHDPPPPGVPGGSDAGPEAVDSRWQLPANDSGSQAAGIDTTRSVTALRELPENSSKPAAGEPAPA